MAKLKHEILAGKLRVNRYFEVQHTSLFWFGFDVYSKERPFYRPWFSFLIVFFYTLTMFGMLHFIYLNIGQIEKVSDASIPFIQGVMGMWKVLILFWNRRETVDLLHRIWELTENANEDDLRILSQKNKRIRALDIFYTSITVFTFSLSMASPLFVLALTYVFKGEFPYRVLMTATYPIRLDKPLNYMIIYIWNVYLITYFGCAIFGVDTLFSWIAHNIAAQFQIVQQKMISLSEYGSAIGINDDFGKKAIVECIKYHQQSIELADYFDRIFRPAVLAEMLMNSIQICFIVYQIGEGIEMSRAVHLIFFLVTILIQMLLYCIGGQSLEDESEHVAVAAYDSIQWEHWSISNRKMLLLTILRAQRSCKISGIFFFINERTLLTVMRAASSYVTLLWSLNTSE